MLALLDCFETRGWCGYTGQVITLLSVVSDIRMQSEVFALGAHAVGPDPCADISYMRVLN